MKQKILSQFSSKLNQFLRLEAGNDQYAKKLNGNSYKIYFTDIKLTFYIIFTETGANIFDQPQQQSIDAEIIGSSLNIIGAQANNNPSNIKITGDVKKAKELQIALQNLKSPINKLVENTLGKQAGYWFDSFSSSAKSTLNNLIKNTKTNISSYVTEECGHGIHELEFKEMVKRIRSARARIAKIEARLKKKS